MRGLLHEHTRRHFKRRPGAKVLRASVADTANFHLTSRDVTRQLEKLGSRGLSFSAKMMVLRRGSTCNSPRPPISPLSPPIQASSFKAVLAMALGLFVVGVVGFSHISAVSITPLTMSATPMRSLSLTTDAGFQIYCVFGRACGADRRPR